MPCATTIFKDCSLLLHIYKKSRLHFAKVASPLNPAVLNLQNPENSAPNDEPRATRRSADHQHHFTRSHAPIWASHASPWCLTRSHSPLQLYDVTSHFQLDPVRWTRPESVTRSEPPEKKMFWPSLTFDFDQKVKIFKKRPTQFFAYIPILESVSLFETLKLCKLSNFQKVDFRINLDQKVKIFKNDLSCLIFRVDSDFEVYFFFQESEITQIVWFYSCWL